MHRERRVRIDQAGSRKRQVVLDDVGLVAGEMAVRLRPRDRHLVLNAHQELEIGQGTRFNIATDGEFDIPPPGGGVDEDVGKDQARGLADAQRLA